ncbi:glycosyltransferase involved in cell wall biosynthesis [Cryobacterium sp. CAN_C3]|uniref:glycosyltransferase family 4 protein n=1 Tax=unclassified Cryobacterium TaxID=2649013 RepID=UPI0018CA318C|nr:glycosyltransferase family 4 protein [Cryobacterium sp. CAN_C3]MEC5154837.1 glycosyltransferase involved in cell wall biosynthesis [Cryobacterium sp. CAN_C3]
MKIAILHGSNDAYGASKVLCQEVECLVSLGHDVLVVVPHTGPLATDLAHFGAAVSVVVDPSLVVLRRSKLTDLQHPLTLRHDVARADVVVLWTLALSAYIPLLRLRRRRFYVSVHELLLGRVGGLLVRILLASGNFPVCACSEATAAWLNDHGVGRDRLTVTSPVFSAVEAVPDRTVHDPLTLAVVGRVNGHKGHLEVAQALQSSALSGCGWRLLLFGAPYPGQDDALRAVLALVKRDPRIEYRGEAASVAAIADQIDAVACFPSTPEPFGLVPIEAWRVGVRSVGFADGGAGEVLPVVGGLGVRRTDSPDRDITAALVDLAVAVKAHSRLPEPAQVNPLFSQDRRRNLIAQVVTQS